VNVSSNRTYAAVDWIRIKHRPALEDEKRSFHEPRTSNILLTSGLDVIAVSVAGRDVTAMPKTEIMRNDDGDEI